LSRFDCGTLIGISTAGGVHEVNHQGTDDDIDAKRDGATIVAVVALRDRSLSQLGLTLGEGRLLSALVSKQVTGWLAGQTHCRRCAAASA